MRSADELVLEAEGADDLGGAGDQGDDRGMGLTFRASASRRSARQAPPRPAARAASGGTRRPPVPCWSSSPVEHRQRHQKGVVLPGPIAGQAKLPVQHVDQAETFAGGRLVLKAELAGEELRVDVHRLGRGRVQVEIAGHFPHAFQHAGDVTRPRQADRREVVDLRDARLVQRQDLIFLADPARPASAGFPPSPLWFATLSSPGPGALRPVRLAARASGVLGRSAPDLRAAANRRESTGT